jgi:2-oxoglutarate dehydrogenase E2 component (dihydrolipoamide succinyltransferase)
MLVDIVMPKMGESIMDGRILKWHKQVGETIGRDETLFEISTDKVDTEVPVADAGTIVELLFQEGDTANVGDVVARLETDASQVKAGGGSPKPQASSEKKEEAPKEEVQKDMQLGFNETSSGAPKAEASKADVSAEPKSEDTDVPKAGSSFFSPLVLNIASKEGVSMDELSKIKGTGIGGRVRKQDILAFVEQKKSGKLQPQAEAKPEPAKSGGGAAKPAELKPFEMPKGMDLSGMYGAKGVEVIPMDNLQSKMAEHMVMSMHTSPHVTAIAECDTSAIDKARRALEDEFKRREGFKLTYMPFICEAVVKALKDFPLINSSIDGNNILRKSFINLGIAVAMENGGLIVPVIKNADSKNLTGLARDINDLAKRARVKKLSLEEIQDGTFTITNYGVFGNIIGSPIINQPQIAILGTGAIKKRAVVVDTPQGDAIVIKPIMYMTLAFDHRLVDGALGGKFLMKIVEYIENYSI